MRRSRGELHPVPPLRLRGVEGVVGAGEQGERSVLRIEFRDPRTTIDQTYDMRMPPYMRHSMGVPLSVTRRQYDQLMGYLDKLEGEWKPKASTSTKAEAKS